MTKKHKILLGENNTVGLFRFECSRSYLSYNIKQAKKMFIKDITNNKSYWTITQQIYDDMEVEIKSVKTYKCNRARLR